MSSKFDPTIEDQSYIDSSDALTGIDLTDEKDDVDNLQFNKHIQIINAQINKHINILPKR
jgi:hypothetical protein